MFSVRREKPGKSWIEGVVRNKRNMAGYVSVGGHRNEAGKSWELAMRDMISFDLRGEEVGMNIQ